MSQQHPTIVFVGDHERADGLNQLVEAHGWTVLEPQEMMEALAMVVFEYPDMVIIEDAPDNPTGHEVYAHLRSIDFPGLLVLTDRPEVWDLDTHPEETLLLRTPASVLVDEVAARINTPVSSLPFQPAL